MKVMRTKCWRPIASSEILVRRERNRLWYAMQPHKVVSLKHHCLDCHPSRVSLAGEQRDFVERTLNCSLLRILLLSSFKSDRANALTMIDFP